MLRTLAMLPDLDDPERFTTAIVYQRARTALGEPLDMQGLFPGADLYLRPCGITVLRCCLQPVHIGMWAHLAATN